MNSQKLIGLLILAAGVVLTIVGLNASDSAADRWSNFFTGHFTDRTIWFIIGGVVTSIAGLGLLLKGGSTAAN